MNKVLATALAAGLAVTMSACGSSTTGGPAPSRYAAIVNGRAIPQSEIFDQLALFAKNPGLLGQRGLQIEGASPGTYSAVAVAGVLQIEISQTVLLEQLAATLGVSPTSAQTDQATNAVKQSFARGGLKPDELPKSFLNRAIRQQALIAAVGAKLAETSVPSEQLASIVAARSPDITQTVELRAIVVTDAATAAQAKQALDAGTPFADVAKQFNQNPQLAAAGGAVPPTNGAILAAQLPDLAAALNQLQPGQTSGVIVVNRGGQQGFFLVQLTKRTPADPATVRSVALQFAGIDPQQLIEERLRQLTEQAKVTVNPRFGQWVKRPDQGGIVVPPNAPATTGEEELQPKTPAGDGTSVPELMPGQGQGQGGPGGAPSGGGPGGAPSGGARPDSGAN